jgi:hypothetical protein
MNSLQIVFHKLLYAVIFLLSSFHALATFSKNDTSHTGKPYKISKQEFLTQYSKDDSSRALIRYYFDKRQGLRNAALLYTALAGAGYLIFNAIVTQASGRDVAVTGIGVFAALLGTSLALAAPIVAYQWLRTSRKRLFSMLNDYKMGKPIPEKIIRSSSFQRFLNQEKSK